MTRDSTKLSKTNHSIEEQLYQVRRLYACFFILFLKLKIAKNSVLI